MSRTRIASLLIASAALLAQACSGDDDALFDGVVQGGAAGMEAGPGGADASSGGSATGGNAGTAGSDPQGGAGGNPQGGAGGNPQGGAGGNPQGGAGGAGGGGPLSCSEDLLSVVDAAGNLVQSCAPSQGCSGGTCVAPCDALAASPRHAGCDFAFPTPPVTSLIKQPCFAAIVTNQWPAPAHLTLEYGGQSHAVSQVGRILGSSMSSLGQIPAGGLPAGQSAIFFLSHDPEAFNSVPQTCPITPAIPSATQVHGTALAQAWHIASDVPVSVFDVQPIGADEAFVPSANAVMPTATWGTNYVAVLPPLGVASGSATPGPQFGQVVALQDNTQVTVLPTADLPSGVGIAAAFVNTPQTFTLNRLQVLQWSPASDMSGSVLQASAPVAFTGGNEYLCIGSATSTGGGCAASHASVPPVRALGSRVVAMPYATRRADLNPESVRYRLVAAVSNTLLAFDPPVSGAPSSLSAGQVAEFESTAAFVVSSQDAEHPFVLAEVMPGGLVTGGSRPGIDTSGPFGGTAELGDEEYAVLTPPAQFLTSYAFSTEPSYATIELVAVRAKMPDGFHDVTVDCLGKLQGWKAIGSGGQFELAQVDLLRAKVGVNGCAHGRHSAESAGAFGLMVWGLDGWSSYALTAGGRVATLSSVVVAPVPE